MRSDGIFLHGECRRIEIKRTESEKSREGMRMSFLHGSFFAGAPGGAQFLKQGNYGIGLMSTGTPAGGVWMTGLA